MAEAVILPPRKHPAASAVSEPCDPQSLGRLLGALASRAGPVPKFLYPSAGTLYPVQAYLIVRTAMPLGNERMMAGTYYHDPEAHALVRVSEATPSAPDGSEPAILLLLVGRNAAIAPIYREHVDDFSMLEAGYMSQALRDAHVGLTLRDAGDPAGHHPFTTACRLNQDDTPLLCWAIGDQG